jgi:hypothetical protein
MHRSAEISLRGKIMNSTKLMALALSVLFLASLAEARDKLKTSPDQRYLMLATAKTSTMQKELDEAADQGFRIVMGSPTSTMEMAILLERKVKPPDTYKYKLLATTRSATMQKELNDAAKDGFRLLPRTIISKSGIVSFNEVVLVLERPPNTDKRYEYKLLATTSTEKLEKEVAQSEADGFILAGIVTRGGHLVIMEKETQSK